MKTSNKLLISLPVLVLLAIALCLQIAGEFKRTGIIPSTGYQVSPTGRVPAFSIITIKGRAFTTQKPEVAESERKKSSIVSDTDTHTPSIFPIAYQLIHQTIVPGH